MVFAHTHAPRVFHSYVPVKEARKSASGRKPAKLTIHRRDWRGVMCNYHVIDHVKQLRKTDWCGWDRDGGQLWVCVRCAADSG